MSTSEELERLVALRDRGVLSEEEFQAEKARLLGQSTAAEPPESPRTEPVSPQPSAPADPTEPTLIASSTRPGVTQSGSPAPTNGEAGQKRGSFVLTGKQVLIGLLVLVLIALGAGLGVLLIGNDTAASTGEVFLQPADAQGQHPFTPNVGKNASVHTATASALTPPSGTSLATYQGNSVGLYGGTLDLSSCNPQQMVTYLEANPSKASAWADAEGIPVSQVSTYINGLTPVTLRYDTRVTNHGYVNGQANAIPEILQAGQAVLVDSHGVPRARCYCGNPLTPPVAVSGSPHYVGPQWSTFHPTTVIVVQQSATTINNFTLIDNTTGQAFSRTTGTSGTSDSPAPTCTGGPSMPGVTVCTNPTTTTPPTTVPTTTTTTAPPASSSGAIANGQYLFNDETPQCGNILIESGSPLIVQANTVTLQVDPELAPYQGTITYSSSGFTIQVADGSTFTATLTGTANAEGALMGTGQTGGVNPSGQTGWVCNFSWTASPPSSGTAPGGPTNTPPPTGDSGTGDTGNTGGVANSNHPPGSGASGNTGNSG